MLSVSDANWCISTSQTNHQRDENWISENKHFCLSWQKKVHSRFSIALTHQGVSFNWSNNKKWINFASLFFFRNYSVISWQNAIWSPSHAAFVFPSQPYSQYELTLTRSIFFLLFRKHFFFQPEHESSFSLSVWKWTDWLEMNKLFQLKKGFDETLREKTLRIIYKIHKRLCCRSRKNSLSVLTIKKSRPQATWDNNQFTCNEFDESKHSICLKKMIQFYHPIQIISHAFN